MTQIKAKDGWHFIWNDGNKKHLVAIGFSKANCGQIQLGRMNHATCVVDKSEVCGHCLKHVEAWEEVEEPSRPHVAEWITPTNDMLQGERVPCQVKAVDPDEWRDALLLAIDNRGRYVVLDDSNFYFYSYAYCRVKKSDLPETDQ